MSQIHNLTTTMWACELNDVYVSADADVSVRIVVNDADGVTRFDNVSTYTPVAGKVEFGELSRLETRQPGDTPLRRGEKRNLCSRVQPHSRGKYNHLAS